MDRGKLVVIRVDGVSSDMAEGEQVHVARTPELIHGLRNVIQNAVDFADTTVWIDVDQRQTSIRIAVGDDGPGFSADILPRLGEPYVSTRPRSQRRTGNDEYEGMGLGLFIARTLLGRTGARLSFANGGDSLRRNGSGPTDAGSGSPARPPGAIIEMIWARETLVTSREQTRRALGPNQPFGIDT